MFAKNIIPSALNTSVNSVNGIGPYEKARQLMSTVLVQVRINPETFDNFIEVLQEAGEYTSNMVNKLTANFPTDGDGGHDQSPKIRLSRTHSSTDTPPAFKVLESLKTVPEFKEKIPPKK